MEGPQPPLEPPLDETDCSRPILISCVLLKFFRDAKAEAKPRDEELVLARRYGNKSYLLVLTAQDVKLFATRSSEFARPASAGEDSSGEGDDAAEQSKPELPAFIANAIWARPIARVTQKASKAGATLQEGLSRVVPAALRPKPPDAALMAPPLGDGEELPPDAVASHNIALSQLLDLQQQGAAVHVTFRRQRPSTKFMLVVRGKVHDTAEKLLSPWASGRAGSKDSEQDVLVRSCVLVLADEAAAAELVAELQRAQQRLRAAVQWITRGLPLVDRLSVVMVAVQPAVPPPAADCQGTRSPLSVGARVLACSPAWGAPIAVPAAAAKEAAVAPPGSGPALSVTLYTPKGPHAAVLPISQLMAAHRGGQELVIAEAQPLLPAHACQGSCPPLAAGDQLRVLLHARMEPLRQPRPGPQQAEEQPSAPRVLQQPQALSACAALAAVLAAWLQVLSSGGLAAAGVASLLALVLATAAAVLVLRASLGQPQGAAAERPWGGSSSWALVLLQASLVASADTQRVAAEGGIGGGEEGEEGKEAEAGSRLPKNFRHLVARHPDVLDENMAERFLVSYPSASKAYAALQQCVEWRHEQGMVGLLDRPHPKFATIKHRYPHAALGWSRKRDCLVTLDCYGVWKQSYDALKADGVSEEEMLAHLMLCFDFYFTQLDPRPLPHGESVNIVDLAGLRMSDAAGEAFRFISRAGGLLNLHFPLRLRKAFLINAPSWWGVVWRLVSPLIDSKTRELMCLYSAKEKEAAAAAMLEWIDADVLPREYGGSYTGGLYDSELERKFWRHVESRNSGHKDTPAEAPSSPSAAPPATEEGSG